jgi:agmatine deiminase
MKILVADEVAEREAHQALKGMNVQLIPMPYGDIWLRDTAPIFLRSRSSGQTLGAASFLFNGWGEKYVMEGDDQVSLKLAEYLNLPTQRVDLVFEGGSIDVDGLGTALTTRQCLLNPNRNPSLTAQEIEARVCESLGLRKLLWLEDGLLNDHTDGHIDNVARFVGPGHVVCMAPSGAEDPNQEVYEKIFSDLSAMTDANGRALKVTSIASPGLVRDDDGRIIPASHMNFYIGNDVVVVPIYGTTYDDLAVSQLADCFPNRKTVGVSAKAILTGGGSFHCITQQEPL